MMKKLIKITVVIIFPLLFAGCGAMNKSLHLPAAEGNLEQVKTEIEGGREVDSKDIAGQTALMYAAETGRMEVIKYLVSKGANVNARSQGYHYTALMYAASGNRLEALEYLIARGAEIDAPSFKNATALMMSARAGHIDIVKILLEKGADASLKNKDDKTVLDVAREANQPDIVQLLENL